MKDIANYKFNSVYELVDIIDHSVKVSEGFWNFNEKYFIKASIKFSKDTLLHLYVVTRAINYYNDYFSDGGFVDDEEMEKWYDLFETYSVKIKKLNFNNDAENTWFLKNTNKFEVLFDRIANEVFYILFSNRIFLLNFNNLVAKAIKNIIKKGTTYCDGRKNNKKIGILPKYLTRKGTLKRIRIPQWVKDAVFHRDKGRCVFCNTDLTRVVNSLIDSNYDHIVPLDLFGVNDPCNIQLTCEVCNKSKTNKDGITSTKYIPWWTDKRRCYGKKYIPFYF